ncbi:MAG: heavy metal-associated domain-containing protein [Candidatus Kapaibacterium sp.]
MNRTSFIILPIIFGLMLTLSAYGFEAKEVCVQTNLHCGSCAQKIERGLKKKDGVMTAKSDVDTKVVTVKFDGSKTSEKEITKSIEKMGYTAKIMKTDKSSSGKDCCDTKTTKSAPRGK